MKMPRSHYDERTRAKQQARALRKMKPAEVRVDTWLGGYRDLFPDERTPRSQYLEAGTLRPFRRAYGDRLMQSITPLEAQSWALDHPGHVSELRSAWNHAVRMRIVDLNIWRLVVTPKRTRPRVGPPTEEQLERIVAKAYERRPSFARMIEVAAFTGARQGGLLTLRRADVDLRRQRMTVTEKGDKTRTVVLSGRALSAMREQFAMRERHGWQGATRRPTAYGKPSPLVFVASEAAGSRRHRALKAGTLSQQWVVVRGDFPFGFHSLRHYATTWLAAQGADELDIAVQLGHVNSEGRPNADLVARVYYHHDNDAALVRIERLLSAKEAA